MNTAGMMLLTIISLALAWGEFWLRRVARQGGDANPPSTFVGQIMDSKCATVGSHDAMIKKLDAKDARDSTLRCAKDGSFVLYNHETRTVYQWNDQEKPVRFAGQKVKISGTCEKSSQTIVVASIDAVNPGSPNSGSR